MTDPKLNGQITMTVLAPTTGGRWKQPANPQFVRGEKGEVYALLPVDELYCAAHGGRVLVDEVVWVNGQPVCQECADTVFENSGW